MGAYAAHCMAGNREDAGVGFNFELFTHVTRFLGKKVILLGLYNGQGISDDDTSDLTSYSRSTEVSRLPIIGLAFLLLDFLLITPGFRILGSPGAVPGLGSSSLL